MALPKQIARFDVIGWLGSGSFATVWLAHDRNLDSRVAIKVLAENWSFIPDATRRFIQEARDLRRLDDDRIIRVFEAGELEDGRPYMVMDYADGGSLYERIAKRVGANEPFSVEEAVGISVEIADCLISAHSRKIIHRDLKPSNVLFKSLDPGMAEAMRRDGDPLQSERILLGDFGIARRLEGTMTYTQVVGTPHYMAPEQADPETAKDADYRCDIYAAAVILYELLAGRVPFPYESLARVQRAQREEDPRPIRELRPEVSVALSELVARGLARDLDQRIASAGQWRQALRAVLDPATAAEVKPAAEPPVAEEPPAAIEQATVAKPPAAAEPTVAEPPPATERKPAAAEPTVAEPPPATERKPAAAVSVLDPPPVERAPTTAAPKRRIPWNLAPPQVALGGAGLAIILALALAAVVFVPRAPSGTPRYVFPTVKAAQNVTLGRNWSLNTDGSLVTGQVTASNSSGAEVDYMLVEVIPKSLAGSVSSIRFLGESPEVLQADPVVRYTLHVPAHGKVAVSYQVVVPARGATTARLVTWAQDQAVASADYSGRQTASHQPSPSPSAQEATPVPTPEPTSEPTRVPNRTPVPQLPPVATPIPTPTPTPTPVATPTPTPVNHDPVANDDKWWDSLALNCSYQYWTLSPLGNDTDPDGDSLTLTSIGAYTAEAGYSGLGSVQQVGNQVRYYVPTGFKGTDYGYYYYWISDGRGGTAAATDRVEIYCP